LLNKKVLVVEDEQLLAENLQGYLQAQALEVRIAHNGETAIGEAMTFSPDVMVFDYRLPDMEGFQVLDAVRQNRNCHFVLITGHPTAEVCERARQLGVSHILFKPFPLAELARAVCDLLGVQREPNANVSPSEGFVERRQSRTESFPLQLYDGSWVLADRRRNSTTSKAPDDEQLLTGE
jgi:DNA-binding response OmpR family regulator